MQGIYVLVVEDEYDSQQVVSEMLQYMQIDADIAGTAEQALQMLKQNPYHAAVLDLALPGMDGLQLLKEIRDDGELKDLPCLVVTAYHSSEVKHQVMEAGADAYMPKPMDDTAFMREISRLVGN